VEGKADAILGDAEAGILRRIRRTGVMEACQRARDRQMEALYQHNGFEDKYNRKIDKRFMDRCVDKR
jgi:hypothetical protein